MWSLEETILYYKRQGAPSDQNALICLFREIQQNNGGVIDKHMPAAVAQAMGVKESFLLALIRRIPSLRLGKEPILEICCGPNCSRQTQLRKFAETLTGVTVKQVPCMRMCGKGPNIKWNGRLYHGADVALLQRLLSEK